ncbi:MAG: pyridoxal phosphate-dependent aminotransferase [Firmicutes bacterium]|nr:pyridoxal phosphate-dependent aminotransferase [Bacillota bacterium]
MGGRRLTEFDTVINRRGTCCAKWDLHAEKGIPEDALPLWVADMDFPAPEAVTEALIERAKHGIFGYSVPSSEFHASVVNWMLDRHNWQIEPEWIVSAPGVVPALNFAIQAYTKEGDGVLIQNPVYPPFTNSVVNNNRKLVNNPLIIKDGRYYIDFDDFEAKIVANKVKLFLFCSPHNPVGRVWSRKELETLGDICLKHNVIVVSDEIHQDFVFPGSKHLPLPLVKKEFGKNTLVCTAPSKTFNVAGLQASNIIIPDPDLREQFSQAYAVAGLGLLNTFGMVACEAAYTHGSQWLDNVIAYVEVNADFAMEFIAEHLPQLKVIKPEGLYLLWIDCAGLGLAPEELENFLLEKARLWLNQGYTFGEEGAGYVRLNIACPRSVLKKALVQLKHAVDSR